MTAGPPEPPGKIIPLLPGISRGTGDRRVLLRAAVLQVVDHLVLRAVPPSRRLPLFDQARDLLDEAGWGLDELDAATRDPRLRDALLRALGLLELPARSRLGGACERHPFGTCPCPAARRESRAASTLDALRRRRPRERPRPTADASQ